MGYFPNGSSGMDYEANYCSNCIHGQDEEKGCPVMNLHLLWSYEACNGNKKDAPADKKAKWIALESLIPTSKDVLFCDECTMFIPTKSAEKQMVIDKTQALQEWESIYGKRSE